MNMNKELWLPDAKGFKIINICLSRFGVSNVF